MTLNRTTGQACLAAVLAIGTFAPALGTFAPAVQAQDAENGKDVWRRCRACHDVGPKAKNKVGPKLTGIVGRKAGSVEKYKYSKANLKAGADGLVWTEEKLFEYLKKPRAFMPGTKMAFAGLKDEADRKDLIAYLKKASEAK